MSPSPFPFSLCATAIGSMPHTDPQAAVAAVLGALPELPAWPQLFHRSPLEHLAPQFAEGLLGARVEDDEVVLEGIPGEHESPVLSPERAAGFYALMERDLTQAKGIKGQVVGPLTFASLVMTEKGRPALEDLRVARRLAQLLGRLAEWQETRFRRITRHMLLFLDEPLLEATLAHPKVGPSVALDLLSSTMVWMRGLKGLHCCAPPPWEFLFNLPLDVISFDAYRYGDSTEMAAAAIGQYLRRGGAIAWGVVPTSDEALAGETAETLADRMVRSWGRLIDLGVPRDLLESQALITPACGLAHMTPPGAEKALQTTREVVSLLRRQVATTSSGA